MDEKSLDECYGELGRAQFDEDSITLRIYPYLDRDSDAQPVYEVVFYRPAFTRAELERYLGGEIEFSKFSDHAQIHDDCSGQTLTLVAAKVTTRWQPFDLEDYANQVKNLGLRNNNLNRDLVNAQKQIAKFRSTAIELLRRAEIKAASSTEQGRLQTPAIAALKHIISTFE